MAATGAQGEYEYTNDRPRARPEGSAVQADVNARVVRSIGVASAAAFGALLSGLVALLRGALALVVFGVHLGRAGFFGSWASGVLYAGRSLLGLILVVLLAAVVGAIIWAIGALIYNWVAGMVGGIKITLG